MNAETLDRLLMDRALGGMAPDVEALLDSWLAQNPDAAERARDYDTAAGAARQVLATDLRTTLPPLRTEQIRTMERTTRQLRIIRNIASLAAVLVIGVTIGLWQAPQQTAQTPQTSDAPTPRLAGFFSQTELDAASDDTSAGFWSVKSLVGQARRTDTRNDARVIWNSPVAKPTIGGES